MKHTYTRRRRYLGGVGTPRGSRVSRGSRGSITASSPSISSSLPTISEDEGVIDTLQPMGLEEITSSPRATPRDIVDNIKRRFPDKSPGSISLMLATMLLTVVKTVSADAECDLAMGYTTNAGASAILMQQYEIGFSDAAKMIPGFVGYAHGNIPINVVHAAPTLARELGIGLYEAAQLASGNMNQFAGAMGGYAPTVDMRAAKLSWKGMKDKTLTEQKKILTSNVPYSRPAPNCAVVKGMGMGRKR